MKTMTPLVLLIFFVLISHSIKACYTVYQEIPDPVVPYIQENDDPFIIPERITPLHGAAATNNATQLSDLLNKRFPIDVTDTNGWTPLHYAAFFGALTCVQILCQRGAQVNAQTEGFNTPGHLAILNKHFRTLACLKHFGAQPNIGNARGQTIEQLCIASGRPFSDLHFLPFDNTVRQRKHRYPIASNLQ